MKKLATLCLAVTLVSLSDSPAEAGDSYWSIAPIGSVRELAVCGTTVWAATAGGLFRSNGDPEQWTLVHAGGVSEVACDGSRVIWEQDGIPGAVYVSHDAVQTVHLVTSLASVVTAGLRDLAIAGDLALAAEFGGVFRSTDGGLTFASAYPVLWDGTGGYQITAVWTNGSDCVAAGSGGSTASGIWHSATGESGSWTRVLDTWGQRWLNGSDASTLISGDLYGGASTVGYVSQDAGASWTQLPISWGTTSGRYNRPAISGSRILGSRHYDVFDPDSGTFIPYCDGPLIYDVDTVAGSDMDGGFPSEERIENVAIVETPDPFLLVGEYDGLLWWYRLPGGWPAELDFEPPSPGGVTATPRLAARAEPGSASLSLTASGASWMWLAESLYRLTASHSSGMISAQLHLSHLPSQLGWQPFSGNTTFDLGFAHGLHGIHAWFSDDRGNMTDPSVFAAMTTVPSPTRIFEGGCAAFLLYGGAGQSFTVGASAGGGGDVDVAYFGADGGTQQACSIGVNDTLSFVTTGSGFHQVYLCNWQGYGTFEGSISAARGASSTATSALTRTRSYTGNLALSEPEGMAFHVLADALIFVNGFEAGDTGGWSTTSPPR